jgi:hypothetical protein
VCASVMESDALWVCSSNVTGVHETLLTDIRRKPKFNYDKKEADM